ncbi:hypothetical protein [Haloplasma contractile]|uniref:Uncharacterized protein n=1 Tax=Haloplasma contractile SSD-17B TaxID=1033810 RepID=F7Q1V0_9MOLU|nr:hypothetical protein [Haloplasma contractile]ERJ12239.1 hypothetical protein HLPCO_001766 [Haloplasma contractile SSD-17B]
MEIKEETLKYLEFLQQIISRMGKNSFLIKGWTVTLVSALLGYLASHHLMGGKYLIIIYIPVITFAILDTYYLRLERIFRNKYYTFINDHREFDLSYFKLATKTKRAEFLVVLCSRSIVLTYIPILIMVSFILLFI